MDFPMAVSTKTIKPFCNSITVIESPVEEEERSGIIIPTNYEGKLDVQRGIVIDVGQCPCESWKELERGAVVYYRGCTKINSVIIIDHDQIIAYEEQ